MAIRLTLAEIAAVVALRNPRSIEARRQFALEQLPAWQVPKQWQLAETLDVNERGKLSRAEWRKALTAGVV